MRRCIECSQEWRNLVRSFCALSIASEMADEDFLLQCELQQRQTIVLMPRQSNLKWRAHNINLNFHLKMLYWLNEDNGEQENYRTDNGIYLVHCLDLSRWTTELEQNWFEIWTIWRQIENDKRRIWFLCEVTDSDCASSWIEKEKHCPCCFAHRMRYYLSIYNHCVAIQWYTSKVI